MAPVAALRGGQPTSFREENKFLAATEPDFQSVTTLAPRYLRRLANDNDDDDRVKQYELQITLYTITLAICTVWLIFRVCKDCILVKKGHKFKPKKLIKKTRRALRGGKKKHKGDDAVTSGNEELDFSGRSNRVESKAAALDASERSSAREGARTVSLEAPERSTRGVQRSKSSDDKLFLARSRLASKSSNPTRGVGASKSSDLSAMRQALQTRSISSSAKEPSRGVSRAKTAEGLSTAANSLKSGSKRRLAREAKKDDSARGVAASKSSDLSAMRRTVPARSISAAPKEPTRGMAASKSSDLSAMRRAVPARSISAAPKEPTRSMAASKSADLSAMRRAVPARSISVAPKEPTRGVSRSKSADARNRATVRSSKSESKRSLPGKSKSMLSSRVAPDAKGVKKASSFNGNRKPAQEKSKLREPKKGKKRSKKKSNAANSSTAKGGGKREKKERASSKKSSRSTRIDMTGAKIGVG